MSKPIVVDFLYLDLHSCQRCIETGSILEHVLDEVAQQLNEDGYQITLNKIKIASIQLAKKYRFISSPTIRVNQHDIDVSGNETLCVDCGDLCGDQVNCRAWSYEGKITNEPPHAMIKHAILIHVDDEELDVELPYQLPDNLRIYFEGLQKKQKSYPTITLR